MAVNPAAAGAAPQITGAIRQAAQSTGISFEYLLTTARIESMCRTLSRQLLLSSDFVRMGRIDADKLGAFALTCVRTLHVTPRDRFNDGAGFVSVPVLADRFLRSAVLVDGAYAPKGQERAIANGSTVDLEEHVARASAAARRRAVVIDVADDRLAGDAPEVQPAAIADDLGLLLEVEQPGGEVERAGSEVGWFARGRIPIPFYAAFRLLNCWRASENAIF